jgi:hypothetical protein
MHVYWVRTYVGSSRSEIVVLWYWVAARSRLLGSGGLGRAAWCLYCLPCTDALVGLERWVYPSVYSVDFF